jgi:sigma-E factor negative regulatory protein RseB
MGTERPALIHRLRGLASLGLILGLAATGGFATASQAEAEVTAAELLQRSAKAATHCDYCGTKHLVFYSADHPREMTLRVIHVRPDRTRTEFRGAGRLHGAVLIEIGREAWRFHPRGEQWRPAASLHSAAMDLTRLLANYTVTEEGTERVAGRLSHVVAIKPKRPGNPSRRVWIDAETGLPLKTQFLAAEGNLVSEATFADIQFAVPKSAAALLRPPKDVAKPEQQQPTPGFDAVQPSYLPPGYEVVASTTLSVRGRASRHLQYSDGLGTISLFEEQREPSSDQSARGGSHGRRPHSRGPRVFPLVLRWQHGDMRFTLIGDINAVELRKIAASLPGGQSAEPPPQGDER